MIIHDTIEQGTPEWHELRAGVPTASNFGKIIDSKGKKSSSYKGYFYKLVGERLLGRTEEGFKNEWMERGNELESEARELYEFISGPVTQVGFVSVDDPICGCSPDGLVGEDGGIEIKCPSLSVHMKYLMSGRLPAEYHRQVHGSMYVTGRDWWDFMSYYPGLDPFILRVHKDQEFNEMLEGALKKINEEVEGAITIIRSNP
jgi:putative phage-type endonuclease